MKRNAIAMRPAAGTFNSCCSCNTEITGNGAMDIAKGRMVNI